MVTDHQPTLGVHLLETITKGMYSEPMHGIREYIQNAYDSIRAARRTGLLGTDEGEVRIRIDPEVREVRIRDNGIGLSPEAASVKLLDLGYSDKAQSDSGLQENAGFRGIGRMAGITYCNKLKFITSNGNGKKCIVEFDAGGINRLTRAGQRATTILDAIRRNSDIFENDEQADEHYLEVVLEGVNAAGESFLDEDRLKSYLTQHAPVACNPDWSFGDKIFQLSRDADKAYSLDFIRITIRDADENLQVDVRRPFMNTFNVTDGKKKKWKVRMEDVLALPREGGPVNGWWGWLAVHERRGSLADKPFAGLRLRMHNIAIGDDSIIGKLFSSSHLSKWCFGEVHITDQRVSPNAQRDNFEESEYWNRIREQLGAEVRSIQREIRRESEARNASVEVLEKSVRKVVKNAIDSQRRGFVSRDEQTGTLQSLEIENKKMEKNAAKKGRSNEEKDKIAALRGELTEAKRRIEEVRTTEADRAQAHLGRETRKVLRKVYEVLKAELDDKRFRQIVSKINFELQPGREP